MLLTCALEVSIFDYMKLVVNLKLQPDAAQQRALRETLERCNEACNWLSEQAFESEVFGQYALHNAHYRQVREQFNLTAQAAVRCIAKVADAYKLKNRRETQRTFRKWSAQPYDDRIIRFTKGNTVSIWTLAGRQKIGFVCGAHQRALLPFRKGEIDLMFIRGKWYIACVCDFDEPKLLTPSGVLGVDLGIVSLATDSMGEAHSGAQVESTRRRYAAHRSMLQAAGSRRARRRLHALSGKQSRFQKIVNHTVSKSVVAKAKRLSLSVAVEDLTNIRDGAKARKAQRGRLHNWSFADLRTKIEYKAKRAGIRCVAVNPRNTSRSCPACGHTAKANRRTQAIFSCQACGHSSNADVVGAANIAARGALHVTRPDYFAHRSVLGAVESHPL